MTSRSSFWRCLIIVSDNNNNNIASTIILPLIINYHHSKGDEKNLKIDIRFIEFTMIIIKCKIYVILSVESIIIVINTLCKLKKL